MDSDRILLPDQAAPGVESLARLGTMLELGKIELVENACCQTGNWVFGSRGDLM